MVISFSCKPTIQKFTSQSSNSLTLLARIVPSIVIQYKLMMCYFRLCVTVVNQKNQNVSWFLEWFIVTVVFFVNCL